MSLIYWLSKFSQEAMLVELFLIACITTCYFGYLLLKKRRYGVAKKQIPDNVVRAYLVELISQAEGFKNQLFGEDFKIAAGRGINLSASTGGDDAGASNLELGALKTQLASAISKQEELTKTIASLSGEKAALEAKLASGGGASATAPASGESPEAKKALAEAQDKLSKLESKLAEYEVIEDDLANLKKYQQENKQLRAQLEALKGGAPAVAPAPVAAAAAAVAAAAPVEAAPAAAPASEAPAAAAAAPAPVPPAESPIAAAEETVTETKAAESFEGFVDKVEASLAEPAAPTPVAASAVDPTAIAEAQTASPSSDTPAPSAAAAPAGAPPAEKSDADLLNEFERMLSS